MARPKKEITPEEKAKNRQRSNDNLMSVEDINARRTPEERKAAASKAGKKSGEVRKKNRMMMDMARKILEMPVSENYANVKAAMTRFGISEEDMTYANAVLSVMATKAMAGDVKAAQYVRDSAGLDPMAVMREEQFEYMKENGQNINVNLNGEIETRSRVQIYLPERDADPE